MEDTLFFECDNVKIRAQAHDVFANNFDQYYTCFYHKNEKSLLNSLCDKYGSDKGEVGNQGHPYPWPSHSYADFYERLFDHCRGYIRNVFECGLGTNNRTLASNMGEHGRPGASLRVWRDYFPHAAIYGADVDKEILFGEERISTFYCDQTDPVSINELWSNLPDVEFDFMLDDGLHTFQAGVTFFENSFHKLRDGGIYIIEDVALPTLLEFKNYFITRNNHHEFVNLHRQGLGLGDNSLIVIRK